MTRPLKEAYEGGIHELIYANIPEPECYVEGLLYAHQLAVLFGEPESGKSYMAGQLSVAVSSGRAWGNHLIVPKPRRVLYVQSEGSRSDLIERIKPAYEAYHAANASWQYWLPPSLNLFEPNHIRELKQRVEGVDVMFLDSLYSSFYGKMTDDETMGRAFALLREVRLETTGLAMVVLHHEHRARRDFRGNIIEEGGDSIFGSIVIKAAADQIWRFRKQRHGHPASFEPDKSRSRHQGVDPFDIDFDVDTGLLVAAKKVKPLNYYEVRKFLERYPATSTDTLIKAMKEYKTSARTVYRRLSELEAEGFLAWDRQTGGVTVISVDTGE